MSFRRGVSFVSFIIIIQLILAGCGGGGSKTNPPVVGTYNTYLYVATTNSKEVRVYNVLADGKLDYRTSNTWDNSVYAVKASPSGKYLAVVHYETTNSRYLLETYAINPSTGSLMTVCGSASLEASQPLNTLFTPNNNFLYVIGFDNGTYFIYMYRMGMDGALTSAGEPLNLGSYSIRDLAVSADGRYLYTAGWIGNPTNDYKAFAYRIHSDSGALTLINTYNTSTSPSSVICSGNNVFIGCFSNINGFTINASGELLPMTPSSFSPEKSGLKLNCVDKTGKYILGTDFNLGFESLAIGSNGSLSTAYTFTLEREAFDFVLHPNNQYFYTAISGDGTTNNLFAYSFSPQNGTASFIEGYSAGNTPWDIAIAYIPQR